MPQHLFFCSTRLDIWPVSCFFPLMNCVPQSFLVCISWCTYAGTMKLLSPRVEWSLLAVHSNPFSPSSLMKSTGTSFPDSLTVWCGYVTMFSAMESKQLSTPPFGIRALRQWIYLLHALFSLSMSQHPSVVVTQLQLCRKWQSPRWWQSNDLGGREYLNDYEDQSCPIDQDNKLWDWWETEKTSLHLIRICLMVACI